MMLTGVMDEEPGEPRLPELVAFPLVPDFVIASDKTELCRKKTHRSELQDRRNAYFETHSMPSGSLGAESLYEGKAILILICHANM